MNRFSRLGATCCLSVVLAPALQGGQSDVAKADPTEPLRRIVAVLRMAWGKDFDSNYRTYMIGSSPTVVLIPREEMRRIAAARLDGRARDGEATQGLTISDPSGGVRIVAVYDGLAPLLVAKTIIHEIGHLELKGSGLSRNAEEARVRKIVDTQFFERVFGKPWLERTVAELRKRVLPVEQGGRLYQGHTPEAVEVLYQSVRDTGMSLDKHPLHDQILASMVFIFANSEGSLRAALDFDDSQN